MMAVVLSKDARARAVQLPAWNEALGLPRPWDQQWSLRLQQILAYETDLLEFEDLFNGSKVIDEKVSEMKTEAKKEFDYIQSIGGAVIGIENSYLKEQLVNSNKERIQNIKTVANGDYSSIIKRVDNISKKIGRRIKFLVGKPGLDGHSSGAEQIAVSASDCGMDVLYEGIRLTPEQIVKSSVEEDVHIIGLSILSGSHIQLVAEIMSELKKNNIDNIPVIVGGIIPVEDEKILLQNGVKAVYTPKNYQMSDIMSDIVSIVEKEI